MDIVTILRIVSVVAWVAAAVVISPAAWRSQRSSGQSKGEPATPSNDYIWSQFFYIGIIMMLFATRWWIAPDSDTFFAILYAISGACACNVMRVYLSHERD